MATSRTINATQVTVRTCLVFTLYPKEPLGYLYFEIDGLSFFSAAAGRFNPLAAGFLTGAGVASVAPLGAAGSLVDLPPSAFAFAFASLLLLLLDFAFPWP